jgi:hypothetical protein
MSSSEELSKLSDRAKQAQEKVAAANKQARSDLEKSVAESRAAAEAKATELQNEVQGTNDKVSSWWGEQQDHWKAHVAKVRKDVGDKKAQHDADKTEMRAEDAESYAAYAIDFAYAAIDEAEYAALDAVLARKDADDVAAGSAN